MDKEQLRQNYENACNDYLRAFCEKHEFDFDDVSWVGDDVGGIAMCGDLDFNMTTIITDIDEDAQEQELWKWYDYCAEAGEFNLATPNFHAWIHGCPRTDAATFERLRSLKQNLVDLCEQENSKMKEK